MGKHQVGEIVQATMRITEPGFLGDPDFLHAVAGDEGEVRMVSEETYTVTWHRKGTTIDCDDSEIETVMRPSDFRPQIPLVALP